MSDEPADDPYDLSAEQALLGCLLFDNDGFYKLPEQITPACFYEPIHGAIFEAIASSIESGRVGEKMALHEELRIHPAYAELGGLRYLADLVDSAPPATMAAHFGRLIVELSLRRDVLRFAAELTAQAKDGRNPVDQLVGSAESALLGFGRPTRSRQLTTMGSAVDLAVEAIDKAARGETAPGFKSGIRPLDLQAGSMMAGDSILLAGRPGMGKSALALSIATGVASPHLQAMMQGFDADPRAPTEAGVVQLHAEMDWTGQVQHRHLCDVGHWLYKGDFPTYEKMREGEISSTQREMIARARDYVHPLRIVGVKRTGMTLGALRSIVRRQAIEWERLGIRVGLVTIDHVGLFRAEGNARSRYEAQTEIAIGVKELADELKCPILALVQLSRDVDRRDDKRPVESDLRDSGAWEENADTIIGLYREAFYAKREQEPDMQRDPDKWTSWRKRLTSLDLDAIVLKRRAGGTGTAKLWADLSRNAIRGHDPGDPLF